jgi:tetratricopeptide (TPR) repeat protein
MNNPFALVLIMMFSISLFAQEKAIKLVEKGNDYLARQEINKAEEQFNKAISIDSNCIEAYIQKSDIELQKNEFSKALKLIDRAKNAAELKNAKNEVIAHIYSIRSFIYFNQDNYSKAIEDLNSAIQLNDQNSSYFFMRALIKRINSDLKGCCFDLKQASNLGLEKARESLALYCK